MNNVFPLFRGDPGNPQHNEGSAQYVPLLALQTQQAWLNPDRMKATNDRGLPTVLRTPRNEFVINDGNHRLARALLLGNAYAKVRLVPTKY